LFANNFDVDRLKWDHIQEGMHVSVKWRNKFPFSDLKGSSSKR